MYFNRKRGKFTTLSSLKNVCEQLPDDLFIQVHKSYVVNKGQVLTIDGNIIQIGSVRVPISRSRFDQVVAALIKGKLLK